MTTHEPSQPESGSTPGQPGTPPGGYGDPAVSPPAFSQPAASDPAYAPVAGQQAFTPGYTEPPPAAPVPPAPGYGRPGTVAFDAANVNPMDWGIIAAGVIALIFSSFGYYTYKVSFAGFSRSASFSAWHGALAPIATLLAVAAAVLLAVQVLSTVKLAFPVRLVVLAAFALASLLLLLALFVIPGGDTSGAEGLGISVDKGHGIGYWISLLAVLAGTGLAAKRFLDTGGKLPARG